jgi:hypothetical protein
MSIFLTANSPGLRTSPVKRGYWVARRVLGEIIPPPPPTVPELPQDEAKLDLPSRFIRQQMASVIQLLVQTARLSDGTRKVPTTLDPELAADFLALGYCYLQIELLTRQMRYSSNLDEAYFKGTLDPVAYPTQPSDRYIEDVSVRLARAMPRELQWVASGGLLSRVRTITASIRASSIVRGVPDRGSSQRPSSRCSAKRRRHLPTVSGSIPRRAATTLLCSPSTQARMIRARSAKPCAVLRRDTSDANSARSTSSSSSGPNRRPMTDPPK